MKVIVTRSEFKGRSTLVLSSGEEDKYPFSFGLSKAQKILAAYEEIKKFVQEEEAKLSSQQSS